MYNVRYSSFEVELYYQYTLYLYVCTISYSGNNTSEYIVLNNKARNPKPSLREASHECDLELNKSPADKMLPPFIVIGLSYTVLKFYFRFKTLNPS